MFKRLKLSSEFSKNILTLMTGTTIAQAIPIIISPILTRLYTPEDFGVFALYISIVSFLSIIVTARYELAIVLPKKNEDAINILALSLIIMFSIVIITFISILIFKEPILKILNAEDIGNLIYLVPFSILLAGLNQSFNYWSNRKKYFKNISSAQVFQSIVIGISQPLLGIANIFGALIIGNIMGKVVSTFILIHNFITTDKALLKHIKKNTLFKQMKRYKDFPMINSVHAFSDIARVSGSVLVIASTYGATTLGFYALSIKVIQAPVGIISSALGQVLYQKFSSIHNREASLYPYVKNVTYKLLLIALPIFIILFIIAPELFAFIFGEQWRIAGQYSQILIPYLFMNFLISPLSSLPIILEKQKEIFYISLVGNIAYILVFILFQNQNILQVLLILSYTQLIFYFYVAYWYYNLIKKEGQAVR